MEIAPDPNYAKQLHAFRKRMLEELAALRLTELKPGFPHEQVIPKATYAPWRADRPFLELLEKVQSSTLVDIYRLHELHRLAGSMAPVSGDMLEVGVWRGGSAAILGARARDIPGCKLWLADTFAGVPKSSSGHDTLYVGGEHADTSVAQVEALLARCGISEYEILRGLFPQETGTRLQDRSFRLVHIDVDAYESASRTFEWAWPRVVPGGVIIFDDFGFWGCEGVTHLANELCNRGHLVIHNLNGHAIVVKVAPDPAGS